MTGDPQKASLWANADVFVAPVGTPLPANAEAPLTGAWQPVGLLDGDAGFQHTRTQDRSDLFAWGQVLVRTSRRNFKLEVGFTALEDNDQTRALIWPGSSPTTLKVPKPVPVLIALELREGTQVKRLITASHAECTCDSYNETEADLTKYPITATIFPTAGGDLWTVQDTGVRVVSSVTVTGSGPSSVGEIGKLTATANLSPSGSVDVSTIAEWVSSDPAVATVHFGYVEALDDGSADVTASYGGKTSTPTTVAVS